MCCCSNQNKYVKDLIGATAVEPMKSLATDPVCGMTVDPARAASVDHNGKEFYLCCQGCVTKFQADPAKYLQPMQAAPELLLYPMIAAAAMRFSSVSVLSNELRLRATKL